jgi:hypothetical protein
MMLVYTCTFFRVLAIVTYMVIVKKRSFMKKKVATKKSAPKKLNDNEPLDYSKLKPQEILFLELFKNHGNAAKAYAEAFGETMARAYSQANKLQRKLDPYVREIAMEKLIRIKIDADDILGEILAIAKANVADAYTGAGKLRPVEEWPEGLKLSLAGISTSFSSTREGDSESVSVKFHPKLKALELLAKHLKLLTDKVEVDFSESTAERLARARAAQKIGSDD